MSPIITYLLLLVFALHAVDTLSPFSNILRNNITSFQRQQQLQENELSVGIWVKSSPRSMLYDEFLLERSFEVAVIPEYYIGTSAALHQYSIFYPVISTEYISLSTFILVYGSIEISCKELFCPSNGASIHPLAKQFSKNLFNNTQDAVFYSLLMNFCYYSGNILHNGLYMEYDKSGLTQYEAFHLAMNETYSSKSSTGPCKNYTIPYSREACNGGYPLSIHLNSQTIQVCYCPQFGDFSFGYQCDMYTANLLDLRYQYAPYAVAMVAALLMVLIIITLLIPIIISKCKYCFTALKNKTKIQLKRIISLRITCILLLLVALLFQAINSIFERPTSETRDYRFLRGVFSLLSEALLLVCCSILMIYHSIKTEQVIKQTVKAKPQLLFQIGLPFFLIINLIVLLYFICGIIALFFVNDTKWIWMPAEFVLSIWYIFITFVYTANGIRMYIRLKHLEGKLLEKVSIKELRIVKFIICLSILHIFSSIFFFVTALSWFAWDMFGILSYLFTPIIFDTIVLIKIVILFETLYSHSLFIDSFFCCRKK